MLQNRIGRPISRLLASRSQFGNDLVCEAFQMLHFVEHRVEQQMLGARRGRPRQPCRDIRQHRPRSPVARPYRRCHNAPQTTRAGAVPRDRGRRRWRGRCAWTRASPPGSRPASSRYARICAACWMKSPVEDEPAPIQASPSRAARRSAGSLRAPNQIGGCGLCTGLGSIAASSRFQKLPDTRALDWVQSAFITAIPSTKRRILRSLE